MKFIKPKKLKIGGTIGIISPSWGGPATFPHIYNEGLRVLTEELGFKVKEFPGTRLPADVIYKNPKLRAKDINSAFADPEVDAVIVSIGGDDSVRVLSFLDKELIMSNPKLLMGYSDTTTILSFLNQLGLVTFHGPSIMAGFSQWSSLEDSWKEHIKLLLTENTTGYTYPKFEFYSDGYKDWGNQNNLGQVNTPQVSDNWRVLQGTAKVEGELFGGCIEVLEFMKSTEFWPNSEFWNGKILFFETSEEKPTPDVVKRMLRNYGSQGIFSKVNGLLFGRARSYSEAEKKDLDSAIISVVKDEFENSELPIISNMNFGHTDPQFILPLGVKAELNPKESSLVLLESALS